MSGTNSIYSPYPGSFRVYLRFTDGDTLTAAFADTYDYHIAWTAIGQ